VEPAGSPKGLHLDEAAIGALELQLEIPGRPGAGVLPDALLRIRGEQVDEPPAQQLGASASHHRGQTVVQLHDPEVLMHEDAVKSMLQQNPIPFLAFPQGGLRALSLGDHVEHGYEVFFLGTVHRDQKPHSQRLDVGLHLFGPAGQRHSGVSLEQRRIRLTQARNHFGHLSPGHVSQSGQSLEGPIHFQVGDVHRPTVLEVHPAKGETIQHVVEQRAIVFFAHP
jgi:hypothetical protein